MANSDALRYRICLWMVWAQIGLVPILYLMFVAVDAGYVWRWNLLSWVLGVGYLIGLFAWPLSRGLEKPALLKWWLRIDMALTIVLFIPLVFILMATMVRYDSEKGEYVIYTQGGNMVQPHHSIGRKSGPFIKYIGTVGRDVDKFPDDAWTVSNADGYCSFVYRQDGMTYVHLCPIDSARYQARGAKISHLIDSLYQRYAATDNIGEMVFVMPEEFTEVRYDSSDQSISMYRYEDTSPGRVIWGSVATLNFPPREAIADSVEVLLCDRNHRFMLPADSLKWMSPTDLCRFINQLDDNR